MNVKGEMMSEETAIVARETTEVAPQTYFAATNSEEMAKAQSGLTEWVTEKLDRVKADHSELAAAYQYAVEHKWQTVVLKRHMEKAREVSVYYSKMLEALKAGYVIVPVMPIDVFAVRTARPAPMPVVNVERDGQDRNNHNQVNADRSPVGEGEYHSDEAVRQQRFMHYVKNDKGEDKALYRFHNSDFQDVAFPMIAAKPNVMSAAVQAMQQKVFDEIGILTNAGIGRQKYSRRGDPLIIGTILGPGPRWSRKQCHFLISWHINPEDL